MPVATATMTRIQKLFRRPSSPRKGQSGGGGAWDETKYGGRTTSTTSRTSSSGSIESMGSLDTSFRSRRPSSEPKPADRVTWADAPTWIDPPASYDFTDPAELWWTAAERREQLARTEWLVALETKRKLRDELRPPIPGESRRGLGVACEPSTPAARAAKIASHRRAIVAASRDAAPDGLARFAAHLSVDAVAAAVALGAADRAAVASDLASARPRLAAASDSLEATGTALSQILRRDSLQAFNAPLRGPLGAGAPLPGPPSGLRDSFGAAPPPPPAPCATARSFHSMRRSDDALSRTRSRSRSPWDDSAASSMDSTCYGSPASYGSPPTIDLARA